MLYVKVSWAHKLPDDPVVYFSELGEDRYETRKVQVYRDGRMEWADARHETGTVGLSEIAFPPLGEIAAQAEFFPSVIDAGEFEVVWRQATAAG
jgi:hypothetical protein